MPPTHPAAPSADGEPSPTVKRAPSIARMLSRRRSRARGRTASAALPSDIPLPASQDAELQASFGPSRARSTPTLDAPSRDTSSPAWARPPGVFCESPASSDVQLAPTPQEAALPPRVATPAFAATRWSTSMPLPVDVSMFDPAPTAPPVPPRSLQRKPSFRDRLRQLQRRRSSLQRESPASSSAVHGAAADYSGSSAPSEPQLVSTEPETPGKSAYGSRRYPSAPCAPLPLSAGDAYPTPSSDGTTASLLWDATPSAASASTADTSASFGAGASVTDSPSLVAAKHGVQRTKEAASYSGLRRHTASAAQQAYMDASPQLGHGATFYTTDSAPPHVGGMSAERESQLRRLQEALRVDDSPRPPSVQAPKRRGTGKSTRRRPPPSSTPVSFTDELPPFREVKAERRLQIEHANNLYDADALRSQRATILVTETNDAATRARRHAVDE